jgi:hypothetical protein
MLRNITPNERTSGSQKAWMTNTSGLRTRSNSSYGFEMARLEDDHSGRSAFAGLFLTPLLLSGSIGS